MIGHILYLCGPARCLGIEASARRFFFDLKRYQKTSGKFRAKSSLSEARSKLPWQAMSYLLSESTIEDSRSLWRGHDVLAADGSFLGIPDEKALLEYFPRRKSKEHYLKARLVAAVNVNTGQPVCAEVGSLYDSEPALLKKMLFNFKPGNIVLLDRGYTGVELWKTLEQQKLFFVNRLPIFSSPKSLAQQLLKSKKNDMIIEWKGLTLRLIKGKKHKGKRLVLVTNLLDSLKYGRKALLDLYKERWSVETFFKQLKSNLKVGRFHAKTYNGIMQEIFASLLLVSLIKALMWFAAPNMKAKKINFTAATDAIWQRLHLFLRGHGLKGRNLAEFSELLQLIAEITVKIRPNRSYPRISKQPENKWIKARRTRNHVVKGHEKWSNEYR